MGSDQGKPRTPHRVSPLPTTPHTGRPCGPERAKPLSVVTQQCLCLRETRSPFHLTHSRRTQDSYHPESITEPSKAPQTLELPTLCKADRTEGRNNSFNVVVAFRPCFVSNGQPVRERYCGRGRITSKIRKPHDANATQPLPGPSWLLLRLKLFSLFTTPSHT